MQRSRRFLFTSNTTFVVPQDVLAAYITIAGGGGGAQTNIPGAEILLISGASGGFVSSYPLALTPGETINITIGGGGGATSLCPGTIGGTTIFGPYITCTGGATMCGYTTQGRCYNSAGSEIGVGQIGTVLMTYRGHVLGGKTPIGYGSGGDTGNPSTGVSWGTNGVAGAVILDLIY